jgi:cytochrome P450 monooxygenase
MTLFGIIVPKLIIQTLLLLWIIGFLYRKSSRWLHCRSVMRKSGCHELPRYPHKDPIFGLGLFLASKKALGEKRFLDFNGELFEKYGKTFQATVLGVNTIKTMNPEVTKYVHATYFDHVGIEKIRAGVEYLWGDGITSLEGKRWAARRKLIMPAFDVVHIGNLENRSLGKHVDRVIELIPRDGSTIDLMTIFKRLVRTLFYIIGTPLINPS